MATHFSILAWRIPWTEEPVGYSPWGCKESDTTQQLSTAQDRHPKGRSDKEPTCRCKRLGLDPWMVRAPGRRKWQPAPVFFPGKFHGQWSLAGYSLWGLKEPDTTERPSTQAGRHLRLTWSKLSSWCLHPLLIKQFLPSQQMQPHPWSCVFQTAIGIILDCSASLIPHIQSYWLDLQSISSYLSSPAHPLPWSASPSSLAWTIAVACSLISPLLPLRLCSLFSIPHQKDLRRPRYTLALQTSVLCLSQVAYTLRWKASWWLHHPPFIFRLFRIPICRQLGLFTLGLKFWQLYLTSLPPAPPLSL